jgi:hypothetical protein
MLKREKLTPAVTCKASKTTHQASHEAEGQRASALQELHIKEALYILIHKHQMDLLECVRSLDGKALASKTNERNLTVGSTPT